MFHCENQMSRQKIFILKLITIPNIVKEEPFGLFENSVSCKITKRLKIGSFSLVQFCKFTKKVSGWSRDSNTHPLSSPQSQLTCLRQKKWYKQAALCGLIKKLAPVIVGHFSLRMLLTTIVAYGRLSDVSECSTRKLFSKVIMSKYGIWNCKGLTYSECLKSSLMMKGSKSISSKVCGILVYAD